MTKARKRAPSRAVVTGGLSGSMLAPLILWGLSIAGIPLPADPVLAAAVGSSIASVAGALVGFFTRGGRAGEVE